MSPSSPYRVLFLCTGNSARSILAEFILRQRAHGRFEACSAGAQPMGSVNSHVLEILRDHYRLDTSKARSKSWDEFTGQHFDFIITLCDKARETCPAWPGRPVTAHWGSPDPAAVEGTVDMQRRAVLDVATQIASRIGIFTVLPNRQLDALRIREIGSQFQLPNS